MKNNQGHANKNSEPYQKFVQKISKITRSDNSNIYNQNHGTFANKNFVNNNSEINMDQYNSRNHQTIDYKHQQKLIYEKMNKKLINHRRNVDWSQNQDYSNDSNNNEQKNMNRNEIDNYKVFYDKSGGQPLGGGKNAPIVQLLNQKNNEYAIKYQNAYKRPNLTNKNNININTSNSFDSLNDNFSQQSIQNMNDNNNCLNKVGVQNNYDYDYMKNNNLKNNPKDYNNITIFNVKNQFPKNIPENSNNYINYNNPNDTNFSNDNDNSNKRDNNSNFNSPDKSSGIASSLFYGLIFGSFGTLLLWCKNPGVREYLKSCYQNINTESILNFFKPFLHPIDLIKSIDFAAFKEILKESLNYLYQFIDDYSDLWRLLGIIIMVYVFWLIIKLIYRQLKKNKKKNKKK